MRGVVVSVVALLGAGVVGCGSSSPASSGATAGAAGQSGAGQSGAGAGASGGASGGAGGSAGASGGGGGTTSAGSGGGGTGGGTAGGPPATEGPTIKILQLNVWQEGTKVEGGLAKIAAAILASEADVAAFSEVRNYDGQDWTTKLLAELESQAPEQEFFGKFAGGDVGLVSRFPIALDEPVFDETDIDAGSIMAWTLEVPGTGPLVVASAHLDYQHYALNWVRGYEGGNADGWGERPNDGALVHETDPEVLLAYNNQSYRDEAIAAFKAFARAKPEGTAVVLCGDFNEGSDLDWTAKAKDEFGHYGAVIPWDNSLLLSSSGFSDAYRAHYPDEVLYPGFTWPAPADGKTTTTWAPKADERDRIDFVYVPSAGVAVKGAWIVGPNATFVDTTKVPNPGQDAFVADDLPWPSDHKGVLIALALPE